MTKLSKQTQDPQLRQTAVSISRFVPMLFSTPMVQAILHGTKTETRRIIDLKNENMLLVKKEKDNKDLINKIGFVGKHDKSIYEFVKKKIFVGDIIWVRETFCNDERGSENGQDDCYYYKADMPHDNIWKGSWKPSLFMPKSAARLFLEVVSVSVERLQDIDEQSAINEGVGKYKDTAHFCDYMSKPSDRSRFRFAVDSYKSLWQKINGQDSYDLNPWVWVYKFRSVSIPADFC